MHCIRGDLAAFYPRFGCHPVYNEVGVVKAHCGGDAVGAWFLTFLIPQRLGF